MKVGILSSQQAHRVNPSTLGSPEDCRVHSPSSSSSNRHKLEIRHLPRVAGPLTSFWCAVVTTRCDQWSLALTRSLIHAREAWKVPPPDTRMSGHFISSTLRATQRAVTELMAAPPARRALRSSRISSSTNGCCFSTAGRPFAGLAKAHPCIQDVGRLRPRKRAQHHLDKTYQTIPGWRRLIIELITGAYTGTSVSGWCVEMLKTFRVYIPLMSTP